MKLNDDGTISVPSMTLTTEELEEALADLAKQRAKMQPAVAMSPATTGDTKLLTQANPAIVISRAWDGGITLALQQFIAKRIARQDVGLASEKLPGGPLEQH